MNNSRFDYMFTDAISFNQNISKWDVSNGNNFDFMFQNASSFDQDISVWVISGNALNADRNSPIQNTSKSPF